jgi:ABC-type nitrate/sulfonate/bicarbonate transport system substrate-binding protein
VVFGATLLIGAAACGSSSDGGSAASSAAAGTNAPSGTGAKDLETIRLQLPWVLDSEFSSIFMADDNGYYADEGIKLELLPGGPNLQGVEAVVSGGSADIGMATFMSSTANAAAQGTPFNVFGSFYPTSPAVWISNPDKPVSKPQDFVDKKIGGPQGRQVQVDAIFKINDLPAGKYTFVPVGFDPSPLMNGDVDVMSAYITDEAVAYEQMAGKPPQVLSYTDAGLPDPSSTFFTTPDYLKDHEDLLVRFMRATMKGIEANKADPEAGAKLTVEKYGKDLNLKLEDEIAKNKAYLALQENADTAQHGLMYIDPQFVAGPVYKGYEAAGIKTVPVDQLLNTSIQEKAAAKG